MTQQQYADWTDSDLTRRLEHLDCQLASIATTPQGPAATWTEYQLEYSASLETQREAVAAEQQRRMQGGRRERATAPAAQRRDGRGRFAAPAPEARQRGRVTVQLSPGLKLAKRDAAPAKRPKVAVAFNGVRVARQPAEAERKPPAVRVLPGSVQRIPLRRGAT